MSVQDGDLPAGFLSTVDLARVLRDAAEVAAGDADHDFVSTLYVLNTDVLEPAGRSQLYGAELRQIASALCAVMPDNERIAQQGSEVLNVNVWVARRRGVGHHRGEAQTALVGLFVAAAERVEADARASGGSPARETAG